MLADQVKGVTDKASAVLDEGLNAASEAVRAGVGAAYAEGAVAAAAARGWVDTGVEAAKAADSQLFGALKGGLEYAAQHPEASAAAGVALGAVLLPGPRAFLVRRLLGRFRSDEARLASAELRAASLAEKVEGQAMEAQKLAVSELPGTCRPVKGGPTGWVLERTASPPCGRSGWPWPRRSTRGGSLSCGAPRASCAASPPAWRPRSAAARVRAGSWRELAWLGSALAQRSATLQLRGS